jgi:hypothetical protein
MLMQDSVHEDHRQQAHYGDAQMRARTSGEMSLPTFAADPSVVRQCHTR